MKNKIIITTILLLTISGIWIVGAKSNLLNNFHKQPAHAAANNTVMKKAAVVRQAKKHVDEDEDSNTSYLFASNVKLSVIGSGITSSGILPLPDITPKSALSTFGNPVSQTTEFSEYYNENVLTYTYNAGIISFIGEQLLSVECLDEGMSFQITKADNTNLLLTSGSDPTDIANTFVSSWENENLLKTSTGDASMVTIFLKAANGDKTDATLSFQLTGDINKTNDLTINKISVTN